MINKNKMIMINKVDAKRGQTTKAQEMLAHDERSDEVEDVWSTHL